MRKILSLMALVLCTQANAGFITGYVVGSMGKKSSSSDSSTASSPQSGLLVTSEAHDVIACRVNSPSDRPCTYKTTWLSTSDSRYRDEQVTVYQYAGYLGYKIVHKVSVVFHDGYIFYVMEVSK